MAVDGNFSIHVAEHAWTGRADRNDSPTSGCQTVAPACCHVGSKAKGGAQERSCRDDGDKAASKTITRRGEIHLAGYRVPGTCPCARPPPWQPSLATSCRICCSSSSIPFPSVLPWITSVGPLSRRTHGANCQSPLTHSPCMRETGVMLHATLQSMNR